MAGHFPEIAQVAQAVTERRLYVRPPAIAAPTEVKENEGVELAPPPDDLVTTPAMVKAVEPEAGRATGPTGGAMHTDPMSPGPIYLQGDHTAVNYRNIVLTPVK